MKLLAFYLTNGKNNEGHTLNDIMSWNDEQLENDCSWIQWLMPLRTVSNYNPEAPILTDTHVKVFREHEGLEQKYHESVIKVCGYFGIYFYSCLDTGNYEASWLKYNHITWIENYNHNHLRMTRLLISIRHMGYNDLSLSILDLLKEYEDIFMTSYGYWDNAATAPLSHVEDYI